MANSSRDEILKGIRKGLYGGYLKDTGQKVRFQTGKRATLRADKPSDTQGLIGLFVKELVRVNGKAKVVKSESEVREFLTNFIGEHGLKSFSIWESDLIKKLGIKAFLEGGGLKLCPSDRLDQLAVANVGITEADFCISDTGTLVLMSSDKKPRSVSLVPPIHVALVKSDVIFRDIHQLFSSLDKSLAEDGDLPSCMTFITGPSRTADIELTLTLGVHGPKELYVLIYHN